MNTLNVSFRFFICLCLSLSLALAFPFSLLPTQQKMLAPISGLAIKADPIPVLLDKQHQRIEERLRQAPEGFPQSQESAQQRLTPLLAELNAELKKESLPLHYVTPPFWEKEFGALNVHILLASYYANKKTDLCITFTPTGRSSSENKISRSEYLPISETRKLPSFRTEEAAEALNYTVKKKRGAKPSEAAIEKTTPLQELKNWAQSFKNQLEENKNALLNQTFNYPQVLEKYLPALLDRLLETESFLFYDAIPIELDQELLGAFIHEKTLYVRMEFKDYWDKKDPASFFFTIHPLLYCQYRLLANAVPIPTYSDGKNSEIEQKLFALERASVSTEISLLHEIKTFKILNPNRAASLLTQAQFQYNEFDLKTEMAAYFKTYDEEMKINNNIADIAPFLQKLYVLLRNKVYFDRPLEKKSIHSVFIDLFSEKIRHRNSLAVIFLRAGISLIQQNMLQQAYPFIRQAEIVFDKIDWKNRIRILKAFNHIGAYNDAGKMLRQIRKELKEEADSRNKKSEISNKIVLGQRRLDLLQQISQHSDKPTLPRQGSFEDFIDLFNEQIKTEFFQQALDKSNDSLDFSPPLEQILQDIDKRALPSLNKELQRPFLFFSLLHASLLANKCSVPQAKQLIQQWNEALQRKKLNDTFYAQRLFLYLLQFDALNNAPGADPLELTSSLGKTLENGSNKESNYFFLYISFLLSQKKMTAAITNLEKRHKEIDPGIKTLKEELKKIDEELAKTQDEKRSNLLVENMEKAAEKIRSLMKELSQIKLFFALSFYLKSMFEEGKEQEASLQTAQEKLWGFVEEEVDLGQSLPLTIQEVYPLLYERQLLEELAIDILSSYEPPEDLMRLSALNLFEILYWLNPKQTFDIVLNSTIMSWFNEDHLLSLIGRFSKPATEGQFLFLLKLLHLAQEKKMDRLQTEIKIKLPSLQKELSFAEHKPAIEWLLSKQQQGEAKTLYDKMKTLKKTGRIKPLSEAVVTQLVQEANELVTHGSIFSQKQEIILNKIKTKNFSKAEKLFTTEKPLPKTLQERLETLKILFEKMRRLYEAHQKKQYYHLATDPGLELTEKERSLISLDQQEEIKRIKQAAKEKINEVAQITTLNEKFSTHQYVDLAKLTVSVDSLFSYFPDINDLPEAYKNKLTEQTELLSKINNRQEPIGRQKEIFLAQLDKNNFEKALFSLSLLLKQDFSFNGPNHTTLLATQFVESLTEKEKIDKTKELFNGILKEMREHADFHRLFTDFEKIEDFFTKIFSQIERVETICMTRERLEMLKREEAITGALWLKEIGKQGNSPSFAVKKIERFSEEPLKGFHLTDWVTLNNQSNGIFYLGDSYKILFSEKREHTLRSVDTAVTVSKETKEKSSCCC